MQCLRLLARGVFSPGCPGPWLFWMREAYLMTAPWTALLALALRLPLRHAAPVHLCATLMNVAATGWHRQLSTTLCPLSEERYREVLQLLGSLAAWPGLPVAEWRQQDRPPPAASFLLVHTCVHVGAACLVLGLLHESECRGRQAFAQQQEQQRRQEEEEQQLAGSSAERQAGRGQQAQQQQGLARGRRRARPIYPLLPLLLFFSFWVGCLLYLSPA